MRRFTSALVALIVTFGIGSSTNVIAIKEKVVTKRLDNSYLVKKSHPVMYTVCGVPMLFIIHEEDGIRTYGGMDMQPAYDELYDKGISPAIAELSKVWVGTGFEIMCPSKTNYEKPKPREWHVRN